MSRAPVRASAIVPVQAARASLALKGNDGRHAGFRRSVAEFLSLKELEVEALGACRAVVAVQLPCGLPALRWIGKDVRAADGKEPNKPHQMCMLDARESTWISLASLLAYKSKKMGDQSATPPGNGGPGSLLVKPSFIQSTHA